MEAASEEKKLHEEKKYAIVTKDTVKMMAEAVGYSDIPDSAAAILGEDVSYRLRETAMNCCQYMRHARRKRLSAEDYNKALRKSDVQPVLGYGSFQATNFRQARDGELYFAEESEVNLCQEAFNHHNSKEVGKTTIKGHWLAIEGIHKVKPAAPPAVGTPGVKKELSEDLMKYYENITKAILGTDISLMKVALGDLQSNPKITPLLPYFINFVSSGVKTVSHDLCQLTKLLHTVKAIIHNTNLNLEPQPYLNLLLHSVMYCILEPLAASIIPRNDHWILRDYAARILSQFVNQWSSPLNHLKYNAERSLKETLFDLTKPLCSHYGALVGILYMGCKGVREVVIPHLSTFMPHLRSVMDDVSVANSISQGDAHKVYGALLLCCQLVLKERTSKSEIQETMKSEVSLKAGDMMGNVSTRNTDFKLYQELYEYFGDTLIDRLSEPDGKHLFVPEQKEVMVKLFDAGETKSGEEMLEDFLQQIKLQQQQEKERKEREEKERLKMEALERERREREMIEEMKRREAERQRQEQEEKARQLEEQKMKKLYEQEEKMRLFEEQKKKKLLEQEEKARQMEEQKKKKLYEQEEKVRQMEEQKKKKLYEQEEKVRQMEEQKKKKLYEQEEKARQMEKKKLYEQEEKVRQMEEQKKKQLYEQGEKVRQVEEQKKKKIYEQEEQKKLVEDREGEVRRQYEELQRREFEKQQKFIEENKQELEVQQQLWYQGRKSQAESAEIGRRRRVPVITYPNEDEEDDDDLFLEEEEKRPKHHNEADSEHSISPEGVVKKHKKWRVESEDSDRSGEESQTMAVRTISDPNQGTIKLKIKKLPVKREKTSSREDLTAIEKPFERHKDSKHKRKRKQTLKSSKEHDPFDFDKSDSDYAPRMSFTPSHVYSSPGGESSGSESQIRKSKLTLKLKVPCKESMSE